MIYTKFPQSNKPPRSGGQVTISDLAAVGIPPSIIRRMAPWAIERIGLDGQPCYDIEDFGLDQEADD